MGHLRSPAGDDGGGELLPFGVEGVEALLTAGVQTIIAPGTAPDFFGAFRKHPLLQEAVQDGIDAAFTELKGAGGAALDLGNELVAIHFVSREEPQDEEFGDSVEKMFFNLHTVDIPRGKRHVKHCSKRYS